MSIDQLSPKVHEAFKSLWVKDICQKCGKVNTLFIEHGAPDGATKDDVAYLHCFTCDSRAPLSPEQDVELFEKTYEATILQFHLSRLLINLHAAIGWIPEERIKEILKNMRDAGNEGGATRLYKDIFHVPLMEARTAVKGL